LSSIKYENHKRGKIFLDILFQNLYNIQNEKTNGKTMDWIEYGIYGVCLLGGVYTSYNSGFNQGVSSCLEHLEEEGYITLENKDDDE
jgi:hypothetical protein